MQKVSPMLAQITDLAFDDPNWLFEIKWDGYRALADTSDKNVELYSRNLKSLNHRFPAIVEELNQLKQSLLLDGEVVVLDEDGKPNFSYLQNWMKNQEGRLVYYVFDLLFADGEDCRDLPLIERKKRLKEILEEYPSLNYIHYCDHILEKGKAFFEEIKKIELEGVVAKKADSQYRSKRSAEWLKVKVSKELDALVMGYTPKQKEFFGALILGAYHHGKIVYIGKVGTGFSYQKKKEIHEVLQPYEINAPAIETDGITEDQVVWLSPGVVCKISYNSKTPNNKLRGPVFVSLRDDKSVEEVTLDETIPEKEDSFSNMDKIFFPRDGYTKEDLIGYYREIAPILLPYVKRRPLLLHRMPDGIAGKDFYQKNVDYPPDDLPLVDVMHTQGKISYLYIETVEHLLHLINFGCIELHPFNARIGSLEQPDYLVIDLDPGSVPFSDVVTAALAFRDLFETLEIPSFCKTSGLSGMHLYVPLEAKYSHEQTRNLAEIFCRLVHRKLPKMTSVERNPEKRKKQVYLDFLQNRSKQSMACAYGVRPADGAPVSTPLVWEEVNEFLTPNIGNIKTIFKRLERLGDPFQPVLGEGIDLIKVFHSLEKLDQL